MSAEYILMSSQTCQLCEDAKRLIYTLPPNRSISFKEQDILLNDRLFDQYRYSIPVLVKMKKGKVEKELAWPFDSAGLGQWLG